MGLSDDNEYNDMVGHVLPLLVRVSERSLYRSAVDGQAMGEDQRSEDRPRVSRARQVWFEMDRRKLQEILFDLPTLKPGYVIMWKDLVEARENEETPALVRVFSTSSQSGHDDDKTGTETGVKT